MPLQPVRHHFSLALRQQVDGATALQVANDGAVALAASPGPFVDADAAWRRVAFQFGRTDQPQQRIAADRLLEPSREA